MNKDDSDLKAISIRFDSELIDDLKIIGQIYGIGYQPLIRNALKQFVSAEFKKIATEYTEIIVNKRNKKLLRKSKS